MRIAVVFLDVGIRGGAEKALDRFLLGLSRKHTLGLFTLSYQPAEYLVLNKLERYEFPGGKNLFGHFTKYFEKQRFVSLTEAIRRWSADVIFVHKDFEYADWLGRKTGRPVVVNLRGPDLLESYMQSRRWEYNLPKNPISRVYKKYFDPRSVLSSNLGRTRLVICVSHNTESVLRHYFPSARTRVIYNGVDHSWFRPTWEDEGYVLYAGRFSPHKNQELLVRALGGAKYPVVLHGYIAGPDDWRRPYLERLEENRPDNFRIMIHKDDASLLSLMQKCSVFAHPAKDEGFGNAILEAMACGKAVIAHDSGGSPESVDGAGFLAGDDPNKWRNKVDGLMASEESRREIGKKAHEYSLRFTWEKAAQEMDEALVGAKEGEI